jgi:hypothetical protein
MLTSWNTQNDYKKISGWTAGVNFLSLAVDQTFPAIGLKCFYMKTQCCHSFSNLLIFFVLSYIRRLGV